MKFRPLIVVLALTLIALPALAQQPLYLGTDQGNVLFDRSLNTQNDLWSWGSLPNWAYSNSPYGGWSPSILYYPGNYYYGYYSPYYSYYSPYYTSYPWGSYRPSYYSYPYTSQY
jgi:hypothetical protein